MPDSLLNQWITEIENHAPTLSVCIYDGIRNRPWTAKDLIASDIILATYYTFQQEYVYFLPEYDRTRRYKRSEKRANSPLNEVEFWRVCLDEAQRATIGLTGVSGISRIHRQ